MGTAEGRGGVRWWATMNATAALCSLIVPGLGQASQGRRGSAVLQFIVGVFAWIFTLGLLGWVWNVCSAFDAASWRARGNAG